ncbi:MAG: sensor histidine kinase [Actinomycetota bacterium]
MSETVDLLRTVDPFSQLDDDDLAAVVERGEIVELPAGQPLFAQGDEGDRAYVVLDGQLEVTASGTLQALVLNILGRGDLVGETSLLGGGRRNATVTAREDSRLLAVGPDDLRAAVGQGAGSLMRTLLDRWEDTRNQVVRGERMAQLGTLAAGIAHELNNPAAAVRRSSEVLEDSIERIAEAVVGVLGSTLDAGTARTVAELLEAGEDGRRAAAPADPLARTDAEHRVRGVLEDHGVPEAWRLAYDAVDAGVDEESVARVAEALGPDLVGPLLELAAAAAEARRLTEEIAWASGHMSQVAGDLGSYSRLGEAPVQEVDVTDGLERAVSLLSHRLDDVEVVRDFDPDLAPITASGSELNQVWTNLIANAADAAGPGGTVTLRARPEGEGVVVEVEDDGDGIPSQDIPRIFDAFFTTKPPGSGTGLGLSISHKIVVLDHRGDISVESRPGQTVFRVFLPSGGQPGDMGG